MLKRRGELNIFLPKSIIPFATELHSSIQITNTDFLSRKARRDKNSREGRQEPRSKTLATDQHRYTQITNTEYLYRRVRRDIAESAKKIFATNQHEYSQRLHLSHRSSQVRTDFILTNGTEDAQKFTKIILAANGAKNHEEKLFATNYS